MAERDQMLTVRQVADWLMISPKTVYRLHAQGDLDAVPVGSGQTRPRIRVPESSVKRFLAARAA